MGALALRYLSDSKRCGCHRENQRNVMVKRGTSIQGLEHEEATKSEREAWLHGHGEVNSRPQAMPTSWHPSFHDCLLLGYLPQNLVMKGTKCVGNICIDIAIDIESITTMF